MLTGNYRYLRVSMTERPRSILVAPCPYDDESPASWIQRVCQMHGITYQRLAESLGIVARHDPDITLPPEHICHIGAGTSVSGVRLRALSNTFHAVRALPRARNLLNFDPLGAPTYRICRYCLANDPVPYLRIAWRFKDWKFCPFHHERLMDRCDKCNAYIKSTRPSLGKSPSGKHLNVSDCAACGQPHIKPAGVHGPPHVMFDGQELAAQDALVATVLNGYFRIEGFNRRLDLGFFLWLRENYEWHGGRIASCGTCENPRLVSSIVRRLQSLYEHASGAMPIIGIVQ